MLRTTLSGLLLAFALLTSSVSAAHATETLWRQSALTVWKNEGLKSNSAIRRTTLETEKLEIRFSVARHASGAFQECRLWVHSKATRAGFQYISDCTGTDVRMQRVVQAAGTFTYSSLPYDDGDDEALEMFLALAQLQGLQVPAVNVRR
jgi:hypothetical protein